MKGTGIEVAAEFEYQGVEAEFSISFDYDYAPALDGVKSGHPDNWTPDEPESFEFSNVCIEVIDGSYVDLSDEDIEKITGILEEAMRNDQ